MLNPEDVIPNQVLNLIQDLRFRHLCKAGLFERPPFLKLRPLHSELGTQPPLSPLCFFVVK